MDNMVSKIGLFLYFGLTVLTSGCSNNPVIIGNPVVWEDKAGNLLPSFDTTTIDYQQINENKVLARKVGLEWETIDPNYNQLDKLNQEEYRVGVGDRLSILIWDHPALSRVVNVKSNGSIFSPYAGTLMVKGKTISEIQKLMLNAYKNYIKSPQIDIDINEYASKKIYLLGNLDVFIEAGENRKQTDDIKMGGKLNEETDLSTTRMFMDAYSRISNAGALAGMIGDTTIKKKKNKENKENKVNNKKFSGGRIPRIIPIKGKVTLFEVLMELGVVTLKTTWSQAYMLRNGKVLPINFKRLFEVGDRRTDVLLKDNDIIYLPGSKDQKVYVLGEVQQNTAVSMSQGNITLIDALSQAGYITTTATKEDIKIIRGGVSNPKMATIDLSQLEKGNAALNIALMPGDIIYVPNSWVGNLNNALELISPTLNTLIRSLVIFELADNIKD